MYPVKILPVTLYHPHQYLPGQRPFFSEDHVRTLLRLVEDMMGNVPISKNEILTRLSNDVEGKEIISVLLVSQVLNRIKYERRQRRAKVH